jgi:hypothetical protein
MRCAKNQPSPTDQPPIRRLATHAALAVAFCGWMTNTCLAATVTAVSDNRSGQISAFPGFGDPIEAGFNINPGENDYDPIAFDQCVVAAGRSACMDITSSFQNLGPGNVTTGFVATGSLNSNKSGTAGHAISDAFLSVKLQVSGVPSGGTTPFAFTGNLVEIGGSGVITLTGPGISLTFNQTTGWNQVVNLANGVYDITIDAEASILGGATGVETLNFSVSLLAQPSAPPVCSSSNETCYLPHTTPGCSDDACCALVCAADPFCCESQWDSFCVGGAADLCAPGFASKWATDPSSGHRYALVSTETFPEAGSFLSAQGANFVSINSGRENNWVRREFVAGFPGLPVLSMLIGLTDAATESLFVWTNGSPVSFTRWAPGEPNNAGNEDAVILSGATGLWNDVNFSGNFYSVAESFAPICGTASGSCFTTHGPGCDDESCCNEVCFADPFCCQTQWDSLCVDQALASCNVAPLGTTVVNPATRSRYRLVGLGSWLQAAKVGVQQKGHLVAINSAAENEWIRLNFLNGPGQPTGIWIGATDQKLEGAFQWINGQPVTFTAWGSGEPNNAGGEDYSIMYASGTWNDIDNAFTTVGLIEIPCEGDLDGDGLVGGPDLAILLGAWGSAASNADFNADATVDAADLAVLLGAWGACPTSNACFARTTAGSDQPGCTACVCALDPFCCNTQWDQLCANQAANECNAACQCGG